MTQIALFATAFRVFFLACAVHAFFSIGIWIFQLNGVLFLTINQTPIYWHTYEMVFGFSRAAILGFLFTAGQNWSGKFLMGGSSLLTLFILWLGGRFAFFLPAPWSHVAFTMDLAAAFWAVYRLKPLLVRSQRHNHAIVFLFAGFALVQTAALFSLYYASASSYVLHFVHLGLLVVVIFIVLIAGRVLPFFASVVIAGAKPKIWPRIEMTMWPLALLLLFIFGFIPFVKGFDIISGVILVIFSFLQAVRWIYWRPLASLSIPILAILYWAYMWLIVGLFMLSLAQFEWLLSSIAWHVLGIGAVGVFILGMMTRVSLGHTGRPIKASRWIILAYITLSTAMFIRVLFPMFNQASIGYMGAALCWLLAFAVFLKKYVLILIHPRMDGKSG